MIGQTTSSAAGQMTSSAASQMTSSAAGQMTSSAAGQMTSSAAGQMTSSAAGQTTSSAASQTTSSAASQVMTSSASQTTSSAASQVTSSAAGQVTSSSSVPVIPPAVGKNVSKTRRVEYIRNWKVYKSGNISFEAKLVGFDRVVQLMESVVSVHVQNQFLADYMKQLMKYLNNNRIKWFDCVRQVSRDFGCLLRLYKAIPSEFKYESSYEKMKMKQRLENGRIAAYMNYVL